MNHPRFKRATFFEDRKVWADSLIGTKVFIRNQFIQTDLGDSRATITGHHAKGQKLIFEITAPSGKTDVALKDDIYEDDWSVNS